MLFGNGQVDAEAPVSSLTISDLDETTLARLRERASRAGYTEAEEARRILQTGLGLVPAAAAPGTTLAAAMRAIFEPLGGHDFEAVRERGSRPPPDFSSAEFGP